MIENYLIVAGLGCGTKANFKSEVLKNLKFGVLPRWYFRTPVKVSGNGLKSASLDMAFPFLALRADTKDNEGEVLTRLELVRKNYEDDLLKFFRSNGFITPPDSANFSIIPFWAGETGYREELEDFNGIRIHILNAVLTVKYRNLNLATTTSSELNSLKLEQAPLEIRVNNLNAYINSADFDLLDIETKELTTSQYDAMLIYNDSLKGRILLLTT